MLKLPRKLIIRSFSGILNQTRAFSLAENFRDPAPSFFDPQVQDILWKLTEINNPDKVFRARPAPIRGSKFQFMTSEQLEASQQEALERAKSKLQMPPVLKPADPCERVLSADNELKGLDKSKLLFVDISQNIPDRKRFIVARDLDGTLRTANWEEWKRAIKIFFPIPHRTIHKPKMFDDTELEKLKASGQYEFILDRACVQFEPDDPDFIKICNGIYNHIDECKKYDVLKSTRHFGPMIFYLAWTSRLDNAIMDAIETHRIEAATDLVRLYRMLHRKTSSEPSADGLDLIKSYLEEDATQKAALERTLKTWQRLQNERREYEAQLKQMHGQMSKM